MRFRVVQTHVRGVPLARRDLAHATGIVGELLTVMEGDDFYKGMIAVARLNDDAGGKARIELIPGLYAPVLHILAPQGMLLTGHERIRERDRYVSHFVQGWWARLP
jgi:hypothetical protein